MPQILDSMVRQLKARGIKEENAFKIATAQLGRAGILKKGTTKLTKKGANRNRMGSKRRQASRRGR